MSVSTELTRPIYWAPGGELQPFLRQTTYVWFALALAVCGYGIYRRIRLWRQGREEVCFDQPGRRLMQFMRDVIAQGKVLRARRQRDPKPHSQYAAWMHGLIFYGFLALFFGTSIVGLADYNIVNVYRGWFYAFVTVICEIGGVALFVGLVMGVARRSRLPNEFEHALDYSALYVLLALLVVQGFFIEGLRLAVQPAPVDAVYSFVGALFAKAFPANLSPASSENIYAVLWYSHMLTTMAFVALVPFTRAMHIVTASLNLYTRRLEPMVLLPTMDFENAEAEYFGPQKITDFSWKDLLSFDSCTNCRRCTDICPANAVGKALDPRAVILKLRDSMLVESHFPQRANATAETAAAGNESSTSLLYESGRITHEEIWACTNCGGCVNECPVGINQMRSIMELRRYQTLTLGEVPPAAAKAIENIKQHKNPWGVSAEDRFKWAEGLEIPIITGDSPEVEWLYYVG